MAEIWLIRHGQASFGAADYDRLSELGDVQSRYLGEWLRRCGHSTGLVATGRMRRHLRTAQLCVEAAGLDEPAQLVVPGLDEFDHQEVVLRHRPELAEPGRLMEELARADDPHRAFQQLFGAAVARWTSGAHDADYACTWTAFRARVLDALRQLAAHDAERIWAFTSGGPIAVVANALLDAPPAQTLEMAWPLVNTSITRIVANGSGGRLVSYNAWPHLETAGDSGLVTHR